jgi:hypothetical protein
VCSRSAAIRSTSAAARRTSRVLSVARVAWRVRFKKKLIAAPSSSAVTSTTPSTSNSVKPSLTVFARL